MRLQLTPMAARGSPLAADFCARLLDVHHGLGQMAEARLCVAIEHRCAGLEEEGIFKPRESATLSALEHDDALGAIHLKDRHSGNKRFWIVTRVRVDDVVGPNDYNDVG